MPEDIATTPQEIPTETQIQTKSSVPTITDPAVHTQKEVERLNNWMIAVVIFVVVTFLLGFLTLLFDTIQEKELYLRYGEIYTNYLEKNAELERKIMDSKIEINNFRNEMELLKARNQFLK